MSKSQDELLDQLIARHVGQSARETTTSRLRAAEAASTNRAQPMAYSTTNVAPGYGVRYEERSTPRQRSAPARQAAVPRPNDGRLAVVFMGTLFCFIGWLIGAKYTIEGLVLFANWLLSLFNSAPVATLPLPFTTYLWLLLVPIAFSLVEFRSEPVVFTGKRWQIAPAEVLVVWCITLGIDFASTFNGTTSALPLQTAILLTAVVTIGPEWLLRRLIQILRAELRI